MLDLLSGKILADEKDDYEQEERQKGEPKPKKCSSKAKKKTAKETGADNVNGAQKKMENESAGVEADNGMKERVMQKDAKKGAEAEIQTQMPEVETEPDKAEADVVAGDGDDRLSPLPDLPDADNSDGMISIPDDVTGATTDQSMRTGTDASSDDEMGKFFLLYHLSLLNSRISGSPTPSVLRENPFHLPSTPPRASDIGQRRNRVSSPGILNMFT